MSWALSRRAAFARSSPTPDSTLGRWLRHSVGSVVASACAQRSPGWRAGGPEQTQLLLLDEVNNHLDIAALEAVEQLLGQFKGALIVSAHDPDFLQALELTHQLIWQPTGWHYEPWDDGGQ
ncbi:ABC transporter ATP-binding protein [Pseudomonas cannabina pv. alisalensis]|nr:ABC transporter ATP-binding protein [Pseudomonas cannabina pv. alisalensis]